MSDKLTPEKRSWNMSRIKGKDTKIEVEVRKYLFSKGYRFRKNDKRYPGKPDIVLPKYHVAIFVHGCFWHRHEGCKDATTPKTRTEFWLEKFDKNVKNDQIKQEKLRELGWKVIVIWECELKRSFQETMDKVEKELTRKPFIGAQN
ncbi:MULTISPECIES: very short patch repair endonuclease [Clostridia]|jgi:DNA mismatch endonuclease (patch repair protein)|uniref:Very short patch repair endonuclease n=2 Tax=Lachnospiraceae TaxID=186803 RepID=A0A8I0AGE3_9FIRM|nr:MULTISPECIES: very short patch repair endonuclease [Clostridia]MBC5662609.1 DNA mismatch endonuclease Vsr [Coprococcus hominis (ex Liu et al. 2022)]RHP93583.1 DNA mismatch endonuclease Vsr [Clostridium sp. AM54-37XD]RHP97398.1 DNA mismatch endonuclease Vsr [Clostridium sp. AM54-14XD]